MKQGKGQGQLSEDWDDYAAFGRHEDKTASDFLDEIYMFNRELEPYEIKTLYESCNFGAARKRKFELSRTVNIHSLLRLGTLVVAHSLVVAITRDT